MLSTISRAIFRVYSNMWVLVTTYKLSSQRVLMTRVNENGMMNRYGKRNFIHGAAEDPNNFHCIGISSCMHDYRAISLKTPHKEQRSLRRKFLPPSSSASDVGCSGGLPKPPVALGSIVGEVHRPSGASHRLGQCPAQPMRCLWSALAVPHFPA